MLALIVWLYRKHPPTCFFGAFFFLSLLPTSNLIMIIGSIIAILLIPVAQVFISIE
jgi:hypothetical protein